MPNATELKALRERLRAAKGPDRDLDDAIEALLWKGVAADHPHAVPVGRTGWKMQAPEYYTVSIDAAVALVERVLPGCCIYPDLTPGDYACGLRLPDKSRHATAFQKGATGPLAILHALLVMLELIATAEDQNRESSDV
jgi:hypothetical protein